MRTHRRSSLDTSIRGILTPGLAALALIAAGFISVPVALAQTDPAPEAMTSIPATIMLEKDAVERFVDALPELGKIGLRIIDTTGADATGMTQMTEAIGSQEEALAILAKHGFDVPEFRDVGYNVMMAYAAGEMKNAGVDMSAARGQFAGLQGMIPEEQFRMIDQQIGNAQQAIEAQPEANIELVRAYKSRIEAATN